MTGQPDSLRAALDAEVAGLQQRELARAVSDLTAGYRASSAGRAAPPVLSSATRALAYAAYRMPATFAAASAALGQLAVQAPGFRPVTHADVGGGTGAAAWAAAQVWPELARVQVLEREAAVIELGRRLARSASATALRDATWTRCVLGRDPAIPAADLITMCYLLGELTPAAAAAAVREAAAHGQAVVLIEPGTPDGYRRVLAARSALIEAGLTVAAPCPHDLDCPIVPGADWCHFAARLSRSSLHRKLKDSTLGHEDEKFSYVAATRDRWPAAASRIVRHPKLAKGAVTLSLCTEGPGLASRTVFRREAGTYRDARNAAWGDPWPPPADERT
ncbi:MAG TPA: small ribosomal subunit Rsm22 family protein [Streptosporangiaceae bacterium]